jgi:hypothetical protein
MTDLDKHLLHHQLYNQLFIEALKNNASIKQAHDHARKHIEQLYKQEYIKKL